jgi:hypothetical protein
MEGINLWAVLAAAASAFLLGGLWYSPVLFLKPWLRHSGMGDKPKEEAKHPARVFGVSFVFSLISAAAFAYLLGAEPPLGEALWRGALWRGALVGFAFVAASFGINYQFADRDAALWLVDGGYHLAQFLVYGLILGLWH